MTSIAAQPYTLAELFGGDRLFKIPFYQRPYAWDEEEASALLSDFLGRMGTLEQALASVDPYFLGTMVVSRDKTPQAHVVDGQQRLTTLTILFVILRALLPRSEADSLDERVYQKGGVFGGKRQRRLELRDADDTHFFASTFQDASDLEPLNKVNIAEKPDNHARLTRVARYFLDHLKELSPEARLRLKEFALTRCVVILVSAEGSDNAVTIFTVLNKRGVDLSTVDIVKAEILGGIQQQGQVKHDDMEQYAAPWEDLEQRLGRDGMEDLINYARTIYRRGTSHGTIIEEFRKYVMKDRDGKDRRGLDLSKVITDILAPLGSALGTIRETNYFRADVSAETAAQLNDLFGWLNQVANSDWLPPAIWYLSKHHHDGAHLLQFFTRLERLAVYLMLTRADDNAREKRYHAVIESITADAALERSSRLHLDETEVFRFSDRLNKDVYTIPVKTRRYLLLRLDAQLPEGRVTYTTNPTVEHVLPQNPSESWLKDWRACWAEPEVRKHYTNSLANLVLLSGSVNAEAANKNFAEKKRIYFPRATSKVKRTPFQITAEVLQAKDWSVATVDARQKRLLGILHALWDLGPVDAS
jgi:hypothetical protein